MFILAFCGPEREEAGVVGSSNYADLVGLYLEFPEFLIPNVNNAVPDYSAAAMDAQKRGLKQFQDRFTAIDISGWPVIPENGVRDFFEQCRDRDPMTQVAHTFFGHYYTHDRTIWNQDGDSRPIRGVQRLFDTCEARSEGLSYAIEEMLMGAGLHDNRPRAREITYIWAAFRTCRAIADLKMHSGEYTMMDAIRSSVEMLPYPWADMDSDAVWWDIENTLRQPGHITFYVVGKSQILQLFAEQAIRLGNKFNLRQFMDDFMGGGIIPISLTRWEMTGLEDQMKFLLD